MTDSERSGKTTRDLVIMMSQQMDDMHSRIDSIPRDCATHKAKIEALDTGQTEIKTAQAECFKVLRGKVSWVVFIPAVLALIAAIGTITERLWTHVTTASHAVANAITTLVK